MEDKRRKATWPPSLDMPWEKMISRAHSDKNKQFHIASENEKVDMQEWVTKHLQESRQVGYPTSQAAVKRFVKRLGIE